MCSCFTIDKTQIHIFKCVKKRYYYIILYVTIADCLIYSGNISEESPNKQCGMVVNGLWTMIKCTELIFARYACSKGNSHSLRYVKMYLYTGKHVRVLLRGG